MATDLDALIDTFKSLDRGLVQEIAKEAAPDVLDAMKASATAGQSPTGEKWKPRKEDGGRALAKAGNAITVRVLGTIIQLQLAYPYAIHNNLSDSKTIPRRQILPDASEPLPEAVQDALSKAAARVFARRFGR